MTELEFKKSKEYIDSLEKIKNYSTGFVFTISYGKIPKKKGNALKIITRDCIDIGILESIGIGLDIHGNFVEETYRRIN